ncbi:conserved hypothetical protein [Candidatus Koribacter versatilis Ellin345]|uniref:Putative gluconeogenesis factor n=1 Tax=Koribacter versatilis (strain Ellin345) TaxID=204669 RepID=Q1IPL1_KORVE|nr:uridine diphosphate-N-acetylglucosamine-binding protein YvcK [Candidatus Koribacter versatilis]ABF41189.1 conserved hypothetical protein [Candidatus Koribacter versatilis Ellin345]
MKVVAIGGGTGLSTILRGLKRYVGRAGDNAPHSGAVIGRLTAIVTVSDDGGSSGRLRKEFNVPPPGDIRNCIVALSEEEELLSRIFQYRFRHGEGLKDHNFGNLFLLALSDLTGDFAEAVRLSSEVLATRGHIFPATTSHVQLEAIMDDGTTVTGETQITASKRRIVNLRMIPNDAQPIPDALQAIEEADLITIGPGSLFTSLVPNLLVSAIPKAICESKAVKVFICNLMTQANESLGLTAADHIRALYDHAQCQLFNYALVNNAPAPEDLRTRYAQEGQEQIAIDIDRIRQLGVKSLLGNYLDVYRRNEDGTPVVRHNTQRVAEDLIKIGTETKRAARTS